MNKLDKNSLKLDLDEAANKIVDFIRETVRDADADGAVIGLSGGVDSSLTATLCVLALGKQRVLGVLMPTEFTPSEDVNDATELARWLGIQTEYINIQNVSEAFFKSLSINQKDIRQRMPMANILARTRMVMLYYYANLKNYLVVGTGDRSEALIGFFTKYGDGGADLLPISHLYKTQVRELSEHLGVSEEIAQKPSSPQLYPGHKATDEIPLGYEKLDPVLAGLFDYRLSAKDVSRLTGVPQEVVEEVIRRYDKSEHKRAYPPMVRD